ncbi:hypothetical protein Taro_037956 [Colocasia esculenta]|uniref:Uncharacterized protein n=1 Tax=Colocasia esculenta TaxID=4460 RepID=A0A843W222_COLES|nr:hypothetical protein [Colocasia esculenta]
MWHPSGRPSCWCRDYRARRDTRGGVAPVGRDLIVTQEAIAIRVSLLNHSLFVLVSQSDLSKKDLCPAVGLYTVVNPARGWCLAEPNWGLYQLSTQLGVCV